jgi:hypothetical protein
MRNRITFFILLALACGRAADTRPTGAQADAIRAEVERAMRDAYDLTKPNVAERMLSLYPTAGRVVSATGGRVLTSRDSVAMGIRYFWNNVGSNMRNPRWVWDQFYVDVLSPTSAVVTATYRVPHLDPHNMPHEFGGAMTEVFEKRDGKWVIVQEHLSDLPAATDTVMSMPTHEQHP